MHNFINRCYGSGGACLFSFPEITRRFLNNAELLEIAGHGGRPWGSKFGRHVPTISRISARSGKRGGGDGGFAGEVAGSDANSSELWATKKTRKSPVHGCTTDSYFSTFVVWFEAIKHLKCIWQIYKIIVACYKNQFLGFSWQP
jgi:hypothetical protein